MFDLSDDPRLGKDSRGRAEVRICQHSFHLVKMEKSGSNNSMPPGLPMLNVFHPSLDKG